MFPSDLISLGNKIIDGLNPISQKVDRIKVEILASNIAYIIRHKVSSQVTANKISVPVVHSRNRTWVGVTVHQLLKPRVVVVVAKSANVDGLIDILGAAATDAVNASLEKFTITEEVARNVVVEVNVARAAHPGA